MDPAEAARVAGLMQRLPDESLDAYEKRLRDLAAQDQIPSGPSGRFITEAVERERAKDAALSPVPVSP
jgi:hypothetical protein